MLQAVLPSVELHDETENQELKDMTLIVSMQYENKIVMAADGMAFTHGSDKVDIPYPTEKLFSVKGTNWILAFSGWAGVESCQKTIEAEVSLKQSPAFNPHLPIGGPLYLDALRTKAQEGGNILETHAALAGFDLEGNPYILSAVLPRGGTYNLWKIAALGVQESTAMWIMNTLLACCTCLEDVKRLAYFTITQIAKQEIKVGHPERYAISLAVLENEKQPQREHKRYQDFQDWFGDWESGLQRCFISILREHQ
jgi:20S proteasome alpha/beta subunit